MTIRVLDSSEFEGLLPAGFGAAADPAWAPPAADSSAIVEEVEELSDLESCAEARDGSCLKGLLFAIGIEAAAAFLILAAWQLWHVLR